MTLLSLGVPMLMMGDEARRSQGGNNNAYAQDNEVSWLDWRLLESSADLVRFTSRLVRFRRAHASLRRRTFFEDETTSPVVWHGTGLGRPDWGPEARTLAMELRPTGGDDAILLIANAHWEPRRFALPPLGPGKGWRRFVDTSLAPGEDALEPGDEAPLGSPKTYSAGPRSIVVLVGR